MSRLYLCLVRLSLKFVCYYFNCQIQNNVSASPIDIAKAYMRSHTSELVPSAYSTMSKSERALYRGDDTQPKPSNPQGPQPLSRLSTCGQGPMAQDQHGYATPLGQRGSFGLQKFPRTPYSRTVYSNSQSRSKVIPKINSI